MRRWIIGTVAVVLAGAVNVVSWAQAQQAQALSEKSTVTLGLAITVGSLVMAAAGSYVGGRIAMVRIEQRLADHCDNQEKDLARIEAKADDLQRTHSNCPARVKF